MTKGCKILATLLVLTLCFSVSLYAERSRQVGLSSNGDLDLSALINPPANVFDQETMTLDGSKIIRTSDRTARTEDGRQIAFEQIGDVSTITIDGTTLKVLANGAIATNDPDTYMAFAAPSLTFEDPLTGMPVNASGAVRLSAFEEIDSPQEVVIENDEYDNRMQAYQDALASLQSSGIQSTTYDIGGVDFTMYANGVALFDPSLPEKMAKMDPEVLDDLYGAQLPFSMPMFMLENGNLLFGDGAVKK